MLHARDIRFCKKIIYFELHTVEDVMYITNVMVIAWDIVISSDFV